MTDAILKTQWERFKAHIAIDVATASALLAPYTKATIAHISLLSEGCANSNYKVSFKTKTPPVVLRIYLRDKSALAREVMLHRLVQGKIPVPQHLHADEHSNIFPYPYVICEWIDGTLMREVILSGEEQAIAECAFAAGACLNRLRQITFPRGGFFQVDRTIRPFNEQEKYLPFALNLLQDNNVAKSLGADLSAAVTMLLQTQAHLLPAPDPANLTHADYDPANIMVKQVDGKWQIAAVLDWEFAFAGSYLLDIGLMLRYSHKLPNCYERAFIAGLQSEGFHLPANWKSSAKLFDLLCLLQLTFYNPEAERPQTHRDVLSLIAHITYTLLK